ncbi:hypothetical protein [Streptomyces sp. NPDC058644]|uniref:hypothetical protein n=1 Tax=unclassified Streptomyces TaxID=2593676 RepID=UPI0036512050
MNPVRDPASPLSPRSSRSAPRFRKSVGEFVQALQAAGVTPAPVQAPFRNPLAPDGECGLMSRDGYTCIRRLNKQGTHNRREWGSPNRIGTHPDRNCTAPFTDDDLLLPA